MKCKRCGKEPPEIPAHKLNGDVFCYKCDKEEIAETTGFSKGCGKKFERKGKFLFCGYPSSFKLCDECLEITAKTGNLSSEVKHD